MLRLNDIPQNLPPTKTKIYTGHGCEMRQVKYVVVLKMYGACDDGA